jgi:hypothetical protein
MIVLFSFNSHACKNRNKFERNFSSFKGLECVIPACTSSTVETSFNKDTFVRNTNTFLIEFGITCKPYVNTDALKGLCYHWFLGYVYIFLFLNTRTIHWFASNGFTRSVPSFLYSLLSKFCIESRFSSKDLGIFEGKISTCSNSIVSDIILGLNRDDIVSICDNTFLENWSRSVNIETLHSKFKILFDEDGSIVYDSLLSHLDLCFFTVRNSVSRIDVKFNSVTSQFLGIHRYRNSTATDRYIASSTGIMSLSDDSLVLEVCFLSIMSPRFGKHSDVLPGDVYVDIGTIPLRNIYSTLFSLVVEAASSVANSSSYGQSSNTLRSSRTQKVASGLVGQNLHQVGVGMAKEFSTSAIDHNNTYRTRLVFRFNLNEVITYSDGTSFFQGEGRDIPFNSV